MRTTCAAAWLGVLFALVTRSALGAELQVGVAASFSGPCEALARRYEARSGHRVVLRVGSTGSLYAQAVNGARFDILLAADAERPRRLVERGLALERFRYARGRLVLIGSGLRDRTAPALGHLGVC